MGYFMGRKRFKKDLDELDKRTRQPHPLSSREVKRYSKSSPFSNSHGGKWIMISAFIVILSGGVIFYYLMDKNKVDRVVETRQAQDDRPPASVDKP